MIGFCTAFASAELPVRSAMQRFNAWVAAAITAANITIGSTVAPVQSLLDSLSYGAGMPWTPTYTYQGATWDDDILNRSTIYINPSGVTIDGITYSDIIISSDATEKFRVNAFDLESAWNIASNSNGTYGSGVGFVNGVPMFDIGLSSPVSQWYSVPYPKAASSQGYTYSGNYNSIGSFTPFRTASKITSYQVQNVGSQLQNQQAVNTLANSRPNSSGSINVRVEYNSGYRLVSESGYPFNDFGSLIDLPFEFDWVSGIVPAEQLPEGSQLHFLVPAQHTDSSHTDTNYNIPELVQNYPDFSLPDGYTFEFDPSVNPDFQLDVDASDALGNIISAILAAYLAGLIDTPSTVIEYTTDEPEPQPGVIDPLPDPDPAPDNPTPGTTIANTDWTKLDEILRWIQSTIDSIRHITESLQTMLDSLFDQIQNIIQAIEIIPQQILDDIETGPSKVFRKALDILKSLFLPLLLPIKAMMGLWHYVVEWLASVNAPFVWIFGVMSGASANMVLPIYATLAGSICIAIYKALGR